MAQKKEKMFTLRVDEKERDTIKKILSQLKDETRYTYYKIILKALKSYRAGL